MNSYYIQGNICDFSETMSQVRAKKVVLFPAGRLTRLLLSQHKIDNIAYICDNSPEFQGKSVGAIPIVSPDALAKETDENVCIIITSPNLTHSFLNQIATVKKKSRWTIISCYWPPNYAEKFYDEYRFIDRRKNQNKLLIILAGYKQNLWDIVFKRIQRFTPDDIDVCVMSSGLFNDELDRICEESGWSYLSTAQNKLTRVQNIAISLHPNAEYIYKLDEDIFICDGFFEGLMETLSFVEEKTFYRAGLVMPILPVNPHGNVRFLEKLGLIEEFTGLFGKPAYDYYTHFDARMEETVYLWQKTLPLDETAEKFRSMPFSYFICPHRPSIGAILFRRHIWDEMGGFDVENGNCLGLDERNLATHFMVTTNFYTAIIADNVLAGHYSFGKAADTEALDKVFRENADKIKV